VKAHVDQDLCIGCGICADICPEVFQMNAADKAEAKVEQVPPAAEAACREAADQCPNVAIQIEE
jgi:ferredoxin